MAPDADLGHITDWASKLVGATTRIAGLLHLAGTLRTGWTQPIPANHVDAAARLGHYFLAHALAVFDTMSADPTIDDARAVLHWIGQNQPNRVQPTRRLHRAFPITVPQGRRPRPRPHPARRPRLHQNPARGPHPPAAGPRPRPGRFIRGPQKPQKPQIAVRDELVRLLRLSRSRRLLPSSHVRVVTRILLIAHWLATSP